METDDLAEERGRDIALATNYFSGEDVIVDELLLLIAVKENQGVNHKLSIDLFNLIAERDSGMATEYAKLFLEEFQ
jgi:hypothetical protein